MIAAMRPAEHLAHHHHNAHAASAPSPQPRGSAAAAARNQSPSPMKSNSGKNSPAIANANAGANATAKGKGSVQRQRKAPANKQATSVQDVFESSSNNNEGTGPHQSTPGLLTLSRPIGELAEDEAPAPSQSRKGKKKAGQGKSDDKDGKAAQSRKKKADEKPPSPSMLSKSAPVNASALASGETTNGADSSALTWQQQLLAGEPSKGASTKKAAKPSKKAAKDKDKATSGAAKEKDSLTWQQALLGSGKPRGPTFDVFADARDAATFGSSGASTPTGTMSHSKAAGNKAGAKGRQRADSAGEASMINGQYDRDHKRGASMGASVHLGIKPSSSASLSSGVGGGSPSTPVKLAYAGPNFHNSPSPASLPMPKFNKGTRSSAKGGPSALREVGDSSFASSSTASSNGDSDEDDSSIDPARFRREQTAPAELTPQAHSSPFGQPQRGQAPSPDRSATIETLLAKMMMPSSSSGLSQ